MRVHHWWLYLVLLISPTAYAGSVTINGVNIQANTADKYIKSEYGGYIRNVNYQAQVASATSPNPNPTKYTTRAVAYTNGTLGKSIKGFAKNNAYQIAFSAAILGVGWILDSITKDIYTTPGTTSPYTGSGVKWCINFNSGLACSASGPLAILTAAKIAQEYPSRCDTAGSCDAILQTCANKYTCTYRMREPAGSGTGWSGIDAKAYLDNGTLVTDANKPSTYPTTAPTVSNPPDSAPNTGLVTDAQAGATLMPALDSNPELQNKIGTDPVTGAVDLNQEVLNKATEVANELAKENDPANTPVTPPTATDPNTQTDSEAITSTPSFCSYASIVCDFIDWFRRPPPPDPPDGEIPESALPIAAQWTSNLGEGSCPSNRNLNFTFMSQQVFSWTPICEFAIGIKPLVIAASGLFALFILAGIGRRSY